MKKLLRGALVLLGLAAGPARAQIGSPTFDPMQNAAVPATVRPADTATVRKPTARQKRAQAAADSARRTERLFGLRLTRPAKAGLLAIAPGGGQIYNHKYWKLPIVYGLVGGLAYWISYQARYFGYYEYAIGVTGGTAATQAATILAAADRIPDLEVRQQLAAYKLNNPSNLTNGLYGARRNLDLSILLSAAGYTLTVLDAVVDAHLSEYDISDDLSLRWQPGAIPVPGQAALAPGFTLALRPRR